MNLGAFSISLSVKNLQQSKEFYQKLGFTVFAGSEDKKYLILKNGDHLIGLFEGMFDQNILTFNPGWNQKAESVDPFTDVREIQAKLEADGLELVKRANEHSSGPESITLIDPDGNPVLIDQHR